MPDLRASAPFMQGQSGGFGEVERERFLQPLDWVMVGAMRVG